MDNFTMQINALDDLQMREFPHGAVGDVLRNTREADAFGPLNEALQNLFDKFGTELSDREYLNLAEWIPVVTEAKELLAVLLDKQ
ncbi:hypothetical protein ACFOSH_32825 [Amycolatopsis speibonae]|uniref:Uncharacterized protein n=1 Tax=Amycolatopsis speibonae TaxID=1450224 RepID=A0ABV7P8J3_9PSEU